MADELTRRERIYAALQEILADEGEVLTAAIVICEWDNALAPRYLSRTSVDPIGRPLGAHAYQGMAIAAADLGGWPEESESDGPEEELQEAE